MRKTLLFQVCIMLFGYSYAQPQWEWLTQNHNTGGSGSAGIAHDSLGNVYVTGDFNNGSLMMQTDTLQNANGCIYVAKYDSLGNEIWIQQFGNSSNSGRAYDVTCDGLGNVFITGTFQTSTFVVGSSTLINNGSSGSDFYLVKIDANGNILWARSEGGNAIDYSFSVCTDPTGVYITGSFNAAFTYGSTPMTNPSGLANTFIAKYSQSGQLLWAKCGAGSNLSLGKSICADHAGNILVCGRVNGSLSFGFQYLPTVGSIYHAMFVFKFDSLGTCAWGRSAGGNTQWNEWNDVTTDEWNNVYLTGSYTQATITFASDTFTNPVGVNNSILFLGKYDGAGNEIWGASTTSNSYGNSITRDGSGNLYVTGEFGYATANSIVYDNTTLWVGPNDHNPDFILMIDTSGSLNCATVVGSGASPVLCGNQTGKGVYYASTPDVAVTADTFVLANPQNFYYNIWGLWSCDLSLPASVDHAEDISRDIFVYPSPANDFITINSSDDHAEIVIMNQMGEIVYRAQLNSPQTILDVSTLATGLYCYTIIGSDDSTSIGRFVIAR